METGNSGHISAIGIASVIVPRSVIHDIRERSQTISGDAESKV